MDILWNIAFIVFGIGGIALAKTPLMRGPYFFGLVGLLVVMMVVSVVLSAILVGGMVEMPPETANGDSPDLTLMLDQASKPGPGVLIVTALAQIFALWWLARRVLDAGWNKWFSLLGCLPHAGLLMFLIMLFVPTRTADDAPPDTTQDDDDTDPTVQRG